MTHAVANMKNVQLRIFLIVPATAIATFFHRRLFWLGHNATDHRTSPGRACQRAHTDRSRTA